MNENLKQNSQTENNGLLATKKMGRPRKEIDTVQFEKLCYLQCTEDEICNFFEITDKTLTSFCKREYGRTFSEVFKQKRGTGKISLRRAQFALAKKNATMAIWLGKQYLGQKDVQVLDATLKEETPRIDLSQLTRAEILDLTKKLFDNDGK